MTFADSVKYNGCVEKTGNKNNIYIILWDNFSFQEMHFRKKRNFPQIKKTLRNHCATTSIIQKVRRSES
jgi:hypothetical protein